MSFLRDSQTWQENKQWREDLISLPNMYEPQNNLTIFETLKNPEPISPPEPKKTILALIPEEAEYPSENNDISLKPNVQICSPPPAPIPAPTSPVHVKLFAKTKPLNFPLNINKNEPAEAVDVNGMINEFNSNPKLIEEISKKLDAILPQNEEEEPNFEFFFQAAMAKNLGGTATETQPSSKRLTSQKQAYSLPNQQNNLNSFFRLDQKDLLIDVLENIIDFVVCIPELTPKQAQIMGIISSVVKIIIGYANTWLELRLEAADSYILTKNLSVTLYLLYEEQIAMLMSSTVSGSLSSMKESKAKIIALLTTPIIIKKIATKKKGPDAMQKMGQSNSLNQRSSSKRKLETPFVDEEEIDEEPIYYQQHQHQPARPVLKLPRMTQPKFMRLESRK